MNGVFSKPVRQWQRTNREAAARLDHTIYRAMAEYGRRHRRRFVRMCQAAAARTVNRMILPNDLVALPEDIFDPLRGVVHGIWVREEDFLIFEFVPV
jgi:hypothetical protein